MTTTSDECREDKSKHDPNCALLCSVRQFTQRYAHIYTHTHDGWLVGWGLTALLTQNRSYRACRFVGIFYSKL